MRGMYNAFMILRVIEMFQRQRYYNQRNRQWQGKQQQPIQPMSDAQVEKQYRKLNKARLPKQHRTFSTKVTPEEVRLATVFWCCVLVFFLLMAIVQNMPLH